MRTTSSRNIVRIEDNYTMQEEHRFAFPSPFDDISQSSPTQTAVLLIVLIMLAPKKNLPFCLPVTSR